MHALHAQVDGSSDGAAYQSVRVSSAVVVFQSVLQVPRICRQRLYQDKGGCVFTAQSHSDVSCFNSDGNGR